MRPVKVKGTFQMDVEIEPMEAITKIKEALGFADGRHTFLCVQDGQLMRGEDISHHGSPQYEYTLVSNNPNWVDLYNSMKCLEDYFRHAENPEWQRVLDMEVDETEAPVLTM